MHVYIEHKQGRKIYAFLIISVLDVIYLFSFRKNNLLFLCIVVYEIYYKKNEHVDIYFTKQYHNLLKLCLILIKCFFGSNILPLISTLIIINCEIFFILAVFHEAEQNFVYFFLGYINPIMLLTVEVHPEIVTIANIIIANIFLK